MRTKAERELARQRDNNPPPIGGERVLAVWGSKLPFEGSLGPWFERELRGRSVSIGEVGLPKPDAYAEHYSDNSCLIVISSTLVDFFEAISRVLAGNAIMASAHEADVAATLSGKQAAERLVKLYKKWSKNGVWRGEQLRRRAEPLPEKASTAAARLSREILFFVLMHEFGHVALHAGVRPKERSPAQEYEADYWALGPAVIGLQGMESHPSYGAAGATIALRVLWALEMMGHPLTGCHPPARHRIAHLRREWRRFLNSDARYFEYTSAAYAFEEALAGAEAIMKESQPVVTAHRLVARLLMCLRMFRLDEISFEEMRDVFAYDLDRSNDAVRARAAGILRRVMAEHATWGREDGSSAHDDQELVRTYEGLLSSPGLPACVAMFRSDAST